MGPAARLAAARPRRPSSAGSRASPGYLRGTTPLGVLAAAGAVGPRLHGHPRHPYVEEGHRRPGRRGRRLLPVPDHRTGPRGRHRPGPGPAAGRGAAVDRHRLPRRDRRLRGGPGHRARQPAGRGAARACSTPASSWTAATANGMAALGWDGGRAGARPAGRLRHRPPGHAPHGRRRPVPGRRRPCSRRPRPTSTWSSSAASRSSRAGVHLGVPDVAGELAAAITALFP